MKVIRKRYLVVFLVTISILLMSVLVYYFLSFYPKHLEAEIRENLQKSMQSVSEPDNTPMPSPTQTPKIIYIDRTKTPTPTLIPSPTYQVPTQAPVQQTASIEAICTGYINEVKGALSALSGVTDFSSGYYAYGFANLYNCCLLNNGNTSSCKAPPPPQ